MAVMLNRRGYDRARSLIEDGRYVLDRRDDWSEHQPTTPQANAFIEEHGIAEYGAWHLGVDDAEPVDRKTHYKYPYGDFARVHRCGVLSAEVRAGQRKHYDVETAAAHLHGMLDALMTRTDRENA
jgi:hypothetical protein